MRKATGSHHVSPSTYRAREFRRRAIFTIWTVVALLMAAETLLTLRATTVEILCGIELALALCGLALQVAQGRSVQRQYDGEV